MKQRLIKKKSHQTVGLCWRCGAPVYNFVTRSDYRGSCINCDEDMYSFEIEDYKRRGTPLCLRNIPMRMLRHIPKW